jgi:RNA polymerase sigma-70 factor (ECF subfamily)
VTVGARLTDHVWTMPERNTMPGIERRKDSTESPTVMGMNLICSQRSSLALTRRSPVIPTSLSLLDRLKVARPDDSDWSHLQGIYLPLIPSWLRRVPGLGDEAADLAQEILVVVFREIPRFDRQREGSFRAWLRQVTVYKVRNYRRKRQRRPLVGLDPADGFLERLSDPNGDLAREWDRDHDKHVVEKLLAVVQPDFNPKTWEAFRRFGVDGEPAGRVAGNLGLSENAVILAKTRVLKRLRKEAGDLLG